MSGIYDISNCNDEASIQARIDLLESMDPKYGCDNPVMREDCLSELRSRLDDLRNK